MGWSWAPCIKIVIIVIIIIIIIINLQATSPFRVASEASSDRTRERKAKPRRSPRALAFSTNSRVALAWRRATPSHGGGCKGVRIAESVKILPVESGILGFGIRNTAQGVRYPTNDWNPEPKFHWQRLESSTWNPESTAWNPESKTVFDSLRWQDTRQQELYFTGRDGPSPWSSCIDTYRRELLRNLSHNMR